MRIHDAGRTHFVRRVVDLGGRVGEEAGLSPLSIFKKKPRSFLLNKTLGYVPLEGRGGNHRGDAVRFYRGPGKGLSVPFARELEIQPVGSTSVSVLPQTISFFFFFFLT